MKDENQLQGFLSRCIRCGKWPIPLCFFSDIQYDQISRRKTLINLVRYLKKSLDFLIYLLLKLVIKNLLNSF